MIDESTLPRNMNSHEVAHKTVLLTGAAGTLGRRLAPDLRARCERLVVSDLAHSLAGVDDPQGVPCDLSDAHAVHALLHGVDAVVHLGGVSVEAPFEPVLQANILGLFNLYEAARLHGVKRVVYASSNHVTGCYAQGECISAEDPARPDGYYGVSKLFGEGLSRMYFDRYAIETVCLRIGTATLTPPDRRSLSTWISPGDLSRLVIAALTAPDVGWTVAYGVSANTASWWDSREGWARIGFMPQDNAEGWRDQVQHLVQPAGSLTATMQGGVFLDEGPYPFPPPI